MYNIGEVWNKFVSYFKSSKTFQEINTFATTFEPYFISVLIIYKMLSKKLIFNDISLNNQNLM